MGRSPFPGALVLVSGSTAAHLFFTQAPKTMGFFNFNKTTNNAAGDDAARKPVILQLNEEQIEVSADDAEGKTIEELFSEYGSDLGDVKRITRYVSAGQIVSDDAAVVPGTIYRGAITSESKGLN